MDLKQVQIVLAVAKHLSFSEAAFDTSYAASVISKQIASLESELGIRIFDRKGRSKVVLTQTGQEILPYLARIKKEHDQMTEHLSALSGHKTLTLVCPRGISGLGEDELISIFCAQNPDVEIQQLEGKYAECQSFLESGEADVSIRMFTDAQLEGHILPQNVTFIPLSRNYLGVILPEGHPALQGGKADLAKLQNETFFFRAVTDQAKEDIKIHLFRDACRSEGFEPKIQLYRDMRPWAAYAMVGKGLCAIPCMHAPAVLYPGTCYVPFSKIYYTFSLGLVHRKDNTSPTLRKFIKCARENAQLFSSDLLENAK